MIQLNQNIIITNYETFFSKIDRPSLVVVGLERYITFKEVEAQTVIKLITFEVGDQKVIQRQAIKEVNLIYKKGRNESDHRQRTTRRIRAVLRQRAWRFQFGLE